MCHLKVGFQVHNWVHQGFAAGGNFKILTFQKYLTVKGQETKVMLILMVVNSDVHTHGYVWMDGLHYHEGARTGCCFLLDQWLFKPEFTEDGQHAHTAWNNHVKHAQGD